MSLISNQKLEMIELSEEGLWKAEMGQKLDLMLVRQVVNAKEEILKEMKALLQ